TQTSISYRLIFKANERDCNIPNYHCQAIGWLLTKSGIRRNLLMVGGGGSDGGEAQSLPDVGGCLVGGLGFTFMRSCNNTVLMVFKPIVNKILFIHG
ncbi:hypothetical protein KJ608_02325, partial [Patescibacteria group bacterium]|nr:hypothetical protein [Patescibacteria group bacterium]